MPTDAASPCWSENWQHHDLQLQREAWPTSAHAHWHSTQDLSKTHNPRCLFIYSASMMQYAPRVCTLVLFIMCRRKKSNLCLGDSEEREMARKEDIQTGVELFVGCLWSAVEHPNKG